MNMIRKGRGSARRRLLAFLQEHPGAHTKEILAHMEHTSSALCKCLNSALVAGLIHHKDEANEYGPPVRRWWLGPGQAEPASPPVLLLKSLGPSTVEQLAEELQWDYDRTRTNLKRARGRDEAHVKGWDQSFGSARAIWAFGPGKDKPRPQALGQAERSRRYEHRSKALREALRRSTPATWVSGLRSARSEAQTA
jgi:hypothetical protein